MSEKVHHRLACINLFKLWRVQDIQHQNGDRSARLLLAEVCVLMRRQVQRRQRTRRFIAMYVESRNSLRLVVFLHREVFCLEARNKLASLVGDDHVYQYHSCLGTKGGDRIRLSWGWFLLAVNQRC